MLKKLLSLAIALAILSTALLTGSVSIAAAANAKAADYLDNSDLIPKILPDNEVKLDANGTPDWVSTLIIGEIRIATATEEGTLQSAVSVLDHYAEMGVNGLWVCPVYDPGQTGNGYSNMGTHTIDPAITGTENYEEGWKELKKFVDEAHKRDIRIFLDVISWGTVGESPLFQEHPDWFTANQVYIGTREFNFANDEFVEWYINEVVDIALKTGCDGFRYDLEPCYAGYEVNGEIKNRLLQKGRKIFTIGESPNERGGAYDVEQSGVTMLSAGDVYMSETPKWWFLNDYNIVDSIKNGEHIGSTLSQDLGHAGTYRYYTNALSNHDNVYGVVNGNRLAIGYQAIFAPFIPLWYLGEEWNESRSGNGASYFDEIDWNSINNKENRAFYEDVKAMLRIRRQYPEIFAYYPEQFIDTNICKVNVAGCIALQAYARYAGDTAMLIVPNYNINKPNTDMTVYVPFKETGLKNYKSYTVTDAETGEIIVKGSAADISKFTVKVPYEDQRVFMVKASGKIATKPAADSKDNSSIVSDNNGMNNGDISNIGNGTSSQDADNNTTDISSQDVDNTTDISSEDGTESEQEFIEEIIQIKKPKENNDSSGYGWLIGIGVAAVVVIGGTIVTVILVRKKKKASAD